MKSLSDLAQEDVGRLMDFIKELRKQGLSNGNIAREIERKFGVKISISTIKRWYYGKTNPFNKTKKIDLKPSPELSYIIGVVLGDGCIRIKDEYHYTICLKTKDKEFAEKFAECLRKLELKARIRQESDSRRLRWVAEAYSKSLYMFLKQPLENLVKVAEKYPKEFLQGLFDSEGFSVVSAGKKLLVAIHFTNSNKDILNIVQKMLKERFNIDSKRYLCIAEGTLVKTPSGISQASKDIYTLAIESRADICRFTADIGFNIKRKQEKLVDALELLIKHTSKEAAVVWKNSYRKERKEWVKVN